MITPALKKFVENPRIDELRKGIENPVDATLLFLKEYDRLLRHHEEETTWLFARARELLTKTAAAPSMYAATKEILIMRVSTVLELYVKDFEVQAFYERHLERYGSSLKDLQQPADKDWTQKVVSEALSLLA